MLSVFVATVLIANICGVAVSGALVGAGLSTLIYLVITGFIGAFKQYNDAVALFGTDLDSQGMNTIVGYVYNMLYNETGGYPSYASSAAIILFIIVVTITVINLIVNKKTVHY